MLNIQKIYDEMWNIEFEKLLKSKGLSRASLDIVSNHHLVNVVFGITFIKYTQSQNIAKSNDCNML
jgi:hypothetical protein